uniref:Death domain-containing protein n=1 Tax=Steinernema glaseri TaxID=37863 RepID=A0A1I7ZVH7_9BILA
MRDLTPCSSLGEEDRNTLVQRFARETDISEDYATKLLKGWLNRTNGMRKQPCWRTLIPINTRMIRQCCLRHHHQIN